MRVPFPMFTTDATVDEGVLLHDGQTEWSSDIRIQMVVPDDHLSRMSFGLR